MSLRKSYSKRELSLWASDGAESISGGGLSIWERCDSFDPYQVGDSLEKCRFKNTLSV